ncbi:hypothetical protein HG537_0C05200 [Torulaspora globosa]|uniref:CCAAT-binding factor domain-containing protein n=1 Tax=Torulaspora globosa TaxID=48254 RepID=A0A7H9HRG4_9SACH|nr:hypothetical protein HG537_0C05200 [Torulaspora sp. CBS 2947]
MVLSLEEIKELAKPVTSVYDKRNYNNILKLVNELACSEICDDEVESSLRFLVMSLFQVFKKLFKRGDLAVARSNNERQQFSNWCRKMYESFKSSLIKVISSVDRENSLVLDSLDVYLQLLEMESVHFASKEDAPYFPNKTFRRLIVAMWESDLGELKQKTSTGESVNPVIGEFIEKYYKNYADIQFYFQSELADLLETQKDRFATVKGMGKWIVAVNHDNHCCNANQELEIFVANPPQVVENESKFKSNFEKNWLIMLNGNVSVPQYKTILLILHKRIIPHLHTPTKLMDFLTDSYNLQNSQDDSAGVIPILALNGLFELMLRFNLEYPNFYKKLYQLITPSLMHVKYRPRFFRLLDTFLASTHLSAHLIASFIKRLARLTLNSSPAAIVTVIPFIYNLLKKHPSCMIMLHNPRFLSDPFMTSEQQSMLKKLKSDYIDPFDADEENPELTHALDSSLWELATLMDHYHPNVATLAKIFAQPFRKLNYNMEDFLDWSYDSLLAAETSRRLKVLPTLEFESFDGLFANDENDKKTYVTGINW